MFSKAKITPKKGFLTIQKQYIMHEISQQKMSLEYAFTDREQRWETDMQRNAHNVLQ